VSHLKAISPFLRVFSVKVITFGVRDELADFARIFSIDCNSEFAQANSELILIGTQGIGTYAYAMGRGLVPVCCSPDRPVLERI
jgi:hypothetical protein